MKFKFGRNSFINIKRSFKSKFYTNGKTLIKVNIKKTMKIVLLAGLIGVVMCADNDIQGPRNLVISGKENSISGE